MGARDNGGQAFPTGEHTNGGHDGMTLRDWFAGQALAGMLAHSTRYRPRDGAPANWHEAIAEEATQIADAMLRERAKAEGQS